MAQAILLRRVSVDRGIDVANRVQHGLLVGEEYFAATIVGLLDNRIKPAEIKDRHGEGGSDRPDRADPKRRDAGLVSC